MKISIFFLLFSMSLFAQRHKSVFEKTTDSINSILYQTRNVIFIKQEHEFLNLSKIIANKNGNVFLIDLLTKNESKNTFKMFNLLDIKDFVSKGNQIQVMDKNEQKIGVFINIQIQNLNEFIKNFKALQHICEIYKNENPKD
jgi:hypothetical protein